MECEEQKRQIQNAFLLQNESKHPWWMAQKFQEIDSGVNSLKNGYGFSDNVALSYDHSIDYKDLYNIKGSQGGQDKIHSKEMFPYNDIIDKAKSSNYDLLQKRSLSLNDKIPGKKIIKRKNKKHQQFELVAEFRSPRFKKLN